MHQQRAEQKQHHKHAHVIFCFIHIFFDDRKQDSATNIAHNKQILTLLKQCNIMFAMLSKIWGNTDGCDEHYICATELYLMSMLSQAFSVNIDRGISALGVNTPNR